MICFYRQSIPRHHSSHCSPHANIQVGCRILFGRQYGKLGEKKRKRKRKPLPKTLTESIFLTTFLGGLLQYLTLWTILYFSSISLASQTPFICVFLFSLFSVFFLILSPILNNFRKSVNILIMVFVFHGRWPMNLIRVLKGL